MGGSWRQRAGTLGRKLTSNPFFPLLFIGEATKSAVFHLASGSPDLSTVGAATVMALLSVVGWLYSIEDVAWGLYEAADTVEETINDDNDNKT